MEGDHDDLLSMGFAGTEKYLNNILWTFVDSEHEINNFSTSNYVSMADIQSIFQIGQSDFVIATLNIQSINAKFDNLYTIMNNLSVHQDNILALFVFRRHGWFWRWHDIVWYTRL